MTNDDRGMRAMTKLSGTVAIVRNTTEQRIDNDRQAHSDLSRGGRTPAAQKVIQNMTNDTTTTATIGGTDELMRPRQVADYLGVTVGHLANLRAAGRSPIPYVRVGTRVRYRRADVAAYIERNTVTA